MSASLIGRLGASAFRLSTSTVSMSLAGSRFSSESAPGPWQRLDQLGKIRQGLDKLPDARLELHRSHHTDLKTEVAQSGAQIVLDGDRLRLQQLPVGQ